VVVGSLSVGFKIYGLRGSFLTGDLFRKSAESKTPRSFFLNLLARIARSEDGPKARTPPDGGEVGGAPEDKGEGRGGEGLSFTCPTTRPRQARLSGGER
jgi:hypothetical protein